MDETREQQKLHGFLQCGIYLSVFLEAAIFIYLKAPFWGFFVSPLDKLAHFIIYRQLIYSKLVTFGLICLVSVGTLDKKSTGLNTKTHIIFPLATGLLKKKNREKFINRTTAIVLAYTSWFNLLYM